MQLICVSRGSYSQGEAFAEGLSSKLGCACLGRENLLEEATKAGIAAGKLEMASLKSRGLNERMMLEREHFQAFATAHLAERALEGPLVYHGRTGHLLLERVSHVMRVRVVADIETRIAAVEQRFGLDRKRAQRYIEQVEADRRRWARFFYGVDWDASSGYDFIVNLEHASAGNVTSAFCAMVELPEFRETPSSRKALTDLALAGRCRMALARDDRTYFASFKVRAEGGEVSITYLPRYAAVAEAVPAVIEAVDGVKQIHCSTAATRILWVQERFDPGAEIFQHVLDVAERWEAAVELLRFRAADTAPVVERASAAEPEGLPPSARAADGGVEGGADDALESAEEDDGGVEETYNELVKAGRAGGRITVQGTPADLMAALDRTTPYSLVTVGDAFLSKGKAARVRMCRELGNTLHERLKVAVVQTEEMQKQYLFGMRQLVVMLLCFGITALAVFLLFTNQRPILDFLAREGTKWRILAAAIVALFVPLFAFTYGKATHHLLKLIRME
jgi:cytidylate kinase